MNTQGTDTAIECFKEATQQIPIVSNPAQWNIANGLANIAYAMKRMESEIESLRADVRALTKK